MNEVTRQWEEYSAEPQGPQLDRGWVLSRMNLLSCSFYMGSEILKSKGVFAQAEDSTLEM